MTRCQLAQRDGASAEAAPAAPTAASAARRFGAVRRAALVIVALAFSLLQLTLFSFWWLRRGVGAGATLLSAAALAVHAAASVVALAPAFRPSAASASQSPVRLVAYNEFVPL